MSLSLIVLPSSALILPDLTSGGDPQVEHLRTLTTEALATAGLTSSKLTAGAPHQAEGTQILVVAAEPGVSRGHLQVRPPGGVVHLGGLGLPGERVDVAGAHAEDLPMREAHPGPDLAVLAVMAGRHAAPRTPILLVGVAHCRAPGDEPADAVAQSITRLARTRPTIVICAGDLSAGHGPKPPRPQVDPEAAERFDQAIVDLLADPDRLDDCTDLAAQAEHVVARGLPSILVAAHLSRLTNLRPTSIDRTEVGGVGGIVATYGGMADAPLVLTPTPSTPGDPA